MAYEERIVQFNEDTVIGDTSEFPIYISHLIEPYRTILILAMEMIAQGKTSDKSEVRMNTDKQAADLSRKIATVFEHPDKEMQDKISEIRGMVGEVWALEHNHRVRVCHRLLDELLSCYKT